MSVETVDVGDVLVIRTGGWGAALIRLGAWLAHEPDQWNHVAVVHHKDSAGVWWGIEGRPGGVGWVDVRGYLNDKRTISNAAQPRTPAQRLMVTSTVQQMLGTEYDWVGIGADACADLSLPALFAQDWKGGGAPLHVVCSSLAAYAQRKAGLHYPLIHPDRFCQPDDWAAFIEKAAW